jgi:predicted DNA-binding transcriptional regulator AlpA
LGHPTLTLGPKHEKAIAAAKQPCRDHDERSIHAARPPPSRLDVWLLSKREALAITNVTFPTIWAWMRAGKFPRARVVGGQSKWLSTEIEAWLAALPVRKLKGDAPEGRATESGSCLRGRAS